MSRARKHVLQSLEETPELTPTQRICKVTELRGDNIFEIQVSPKDETRVLVLLPQKFKKLVWIKKGDYVIVDEFKDKELPTHRGKVKGLIERILRPENIKEMKSEGLFYWSHSEEEESDDDFEVEGNPNRVVWSDSDDSDDSESESSDT